MFEVKVMDVDGRGHQVLELLRIDLSSDNSRTDVGWESHGYG